MKHYSKNRKAKCLKKGKNKIMGYSPFNLTTIQLPAPALNMTKAEYKSAYGIDLDSVDIRSFKLVVFGNNKYAVDQIKEVESGIEIYFNGRILSITDIVQTSNEVYDVANSKPIYCHPIYFTVIRSDNSLITFTCLIFNNSNIEYTKSTFLSWAIQFFTDNPNASIMASGYKGTLPISRIKKHPNDPNVSIAIEVPKNDGSENDYFTITASELESATFLDGVNKIN